MTSDRAEVFGGVDTHKDAHVAAAVDAAGRLLGTAEFSADTHGYRQCLDWLESFGPVARVGVEGTGSCGAGLARYLGAAGVDVAEVSGPNRQMRRRKGKTDAVDAEAAALAAVSGDASAKPKSGDGPVETIRMLQAARRSAVKARTQAANQICGLVVTAPEPIKDRVGGLGTNQAIEVCARMRPGAHSERWRLQPRWRCGPWPAATRRSPRKSPSSTASCAACANKPTRPFWAPAASAQTSPRRCSSP